MYTSYPALPCSVYNLLPRTAWVTLPSVLLLPRTAWVTLPSVLLLLLREDQESVTLSSSTPVSLLVDKAGQEQAQGAQRWSRGGPEVTRRCVRVSKSSPKVTQK